MTEKETQQEFYLISSNDGINSILICELNQEFESSLRNSKLNLSQFFSELYFVRNYI
jgi:hypothetical protein